VAKRMAEWSELADFFEPDGSLRDIYIKDVTQDDWNRVLGLIRERYKAVTFSVNGKPAPLPSDVHNVFELRPSSTPSLSLSVKGIEVACHFFTHSEIEFDVAPEQINRPEQLDSLLGFMRELAKVTHKSVTLTPESLDDSPVLRVEESGLAFCV
jgi:hypothetical protein